MSITTHRVRHQDLPDTSRLLARLPTGTPVRVADVPVSAWDPDAITPTIDGLKLHRTDGNYRTRTMTRPCVQAPGDTYPGAPWLALHHMADVRAYLAEAREHRTTQTQEAA